MAKYVVTIKLLGKTYRTTMEAMNSEEARAKSVRLMIKKMEVDVEEIKDDPKLEELKNFLGIK
jgi:hypothetical protein